MSRLNVGWFAVDRNLLPYNHSSPFYGKPNHWLVYFVLCGWASISDEESTLPLCGRSIQKGRTLASHDDIAKAVKDGFGVVLSRMCVRRSISFLERLSLITKEGSKSGSKNMPNVYFVPTHNRHTTDTQPTHNRHPEDIETTNKNNPSRHTTDTQPTHNRHTTDHIKRIKKKKEIIDLNTFSQNPSQEVASQEVPASPDPSKGEMSLIVSSSMVVLEDAKAEVVLKKETPVRDTLAAYVDMYRLAYSGANPTFTGVDAKKLRPIVEQYGVKKTTDLLKAYLHMRDPVFVSKAHDLQTFCYNLSKVGIFAQTGYEITMKVAREAEDRNSKSQKESEELERWKRIADQARNTKSS